jgi:hypothetical protein
MSAQRSKINAIDVLAVMAGSMLALPFVLVMAAGFLGVF